MGTKKRIVSLVILVALLLGVSRVAVRATDGAGGEMPSTRGIELTEVSGQIVWDDGGDRDGIRPTDVTLTFLADDVETAYVPNWTVKTGATWAYTFEGVPLRNQNRELIDYAVRQDTVTDYETMQTEYDFLNQHIPEVLVFHGIKLWVDDSDGNGRRPESVTVRLYSNGDLVDKGPYWSQEGNTWYFSFTDIYKHEGGEEIEYTVSEDSVDGYETVIDGYEITNTLIPEAGIIHGTKTWVDDGNKTGTRPKSITLRLYANGVEVEQGPYWTYGEDQWLYSFVDLPEYDADEKITYTVKEDPVEGYVTVQDGYDFTNRLIPADLISRRPAWQITAGI